MAVLVNPNIQNTFRFLKCHSAVVRVIHVFFIQHKESAGVYDIERVLKRLKREVELLGDDGEPLNNYLRQLLEGVRKLRAANQQRVVEDEWTRWKERLTRIRKNPLNPGDERLERTLDDSNKEATADSSASEPIVDTGEIIAGDGSKQVASKPK